MEAWSISLLGVPHARRGEEELRPRSKETRAVLASLLLPARLTAPYSSPPILFRQTLAERFWGDKPDSRAYLRQTLEALRAKFGSECFTSDLDTVQVTRGAFVTDIDRIRDAHRQALVAPPDERLGWLIQAEGEMNGPLLEACLQTGDWAEPWLIAQRGDVHGWLTSILLALSEAFEAAGNLNGAMDAVRRALRFQPASVPLQKRLWRLAEVTGQEAALPILEADDTFPDALKRLAKKGADQLTGKETRLFNALYKAHLAHLPLPAQKALPRLAVLPAPFSATVAKEVTGVSRRVILDLAKTPLLQQSGDKFVLLEVTRTCAWGPLPSSTKQQLRKRLAQVCTAWAYQTLAAEGGPATHLFTTAQDAEPFLRATLHWYEERPATEQSLDFMRRLMPLGLPELAREAIPYLNEVLDSPTYPPLLRYTAGHIVGYILYLQNQFTDAITHLEQARLFSPGGEEWRGDQGHLHFTLANAYHYAGDSPTALTHLQEAKACFERVNEIKTLTGCLRVRAEIQNHLGDYEDALQALDEALAIRRRLYPGTAFLADAVFWKGATLMRLDRWAEAEACIEEALLLWQDTGDTTGVGFCLRLMGRQHARQGRYAEARAHLDHSILLHQGMADTGSRLAAVEAKADVFQQEGRLHDARRLYEECRAEHLVRDPPKEAERLQDKISRCQAQIAASG